MSSLKEKQPIINTDKETVALLYQTYAAKLLGYSCKNYGLDKDEAMSVVYKTIYKMAEVQHQITFENEQKKSAFIFKTHINFLRNFFRDRKSFETSNREVALSENVSAQEDENSGIQNPALNMLQKQLDLLEDWQRILLLMRGQDMPYSEIAKFVNKPEDQLKVYYARLKKQIAEKVSEELQKTNSSNHVK